MPSSTNYEGIFQSGGGTGGSGDPLAGEDRNGRKVRRPLGPLTFRRTFSTRQPAKARPYQTPPTSKQTFHTVAMSSTSRPTTRSQTASTRDYLGKRRRASRDENARSLPTPTLSEPPSSSARTCATFRLEDLPLELGVLIVDHLTIQGMASLTLCSKTTARWVSRSLLARVTRCETDMREGE